MMYLAYAGFVAAVILAVLLWRNWPRKVCLHCCGGVAYDNEDMADLCDRHLREYLSDRCIFPHSLKAYRKRLKQWA